MRAHRLLGVLVAVVASTGSCDQFGSFVDTTVTLKSAHAVVVVHTTRFGLQVQDPVTGKTVLSTLDTPLAVDSDPSNPYGPLGATHRVMTINAPLVIEGWDHTVGQDDAWLHAGSVTHVTSTATSASLDVSDPGDPGTVVNVSITVDDAEVLVDATITKSDAKPVSPAGVEDDGPLPGLNTMGQSFVLPADEHFFGLGERYVTVDHRGQNYGVWTEEGGLGRGEKFQPSYVAPKNPSPNGPTMTHAPIPFLVSSAGYGIWLESTYRSGFVLGYDTPAAWRMFVTEPHLRYHVLVHAQPGDVVSHYTALTGRASLPAPWVFGPRRRVDHDGTDPTHGTLVMGEPEEQALRTHHVPTTAIDDATHFLPSGVSADQETYLATWAQHLHALGFKSIGYYNAYVSTTNANAKPILADGRAGNYFLRLEDGTEFDTFMISGGGQYVATVDFTNPAAVPWYQSLLQRALDIGYDGWMLDFGEYVPPKAKFHDGRSGWEMHNAFPPIYEKVVFDYLRQKRGDDFMFFARSGGVGTQAVAPVVWSGDPSASFDDVKGLPANVRAGLSAGMSGIPFWGSDISGYTCLNDPPADKEVYLRWAEFGALSTDMHDENACSQAPPGAPPKWTLWSDAETTQVYGQYASLHTRLLPYTYAAALEAVQTGVPIMRHPILYYPSEPGAIADEFDYFFGPSIYVAPVVRRGETTRTLWLPPGRWADWWTMEAQPGGTMVTKDAPLDVLPLYQRSGSIVALLDPSIDTLAPATAPGVVSLNDVQGIFDLRTVLDHGAGANAQASLTDGTKLSASRGQGPPALPSGAAMATEADLAMCSLCGRIDSLPGGVTRLRVTASASTGVMLRAGGVSLQHSAPSPLRPRWDVLLLP
ncbi:MAG TPA: TIM-barrel domain-containing protein [Polyangiaceae bacterium]